MKILQVGYKTILFSDGHTPTRVIIGILYRIFLHQTPSNRIPAALRKYSIYIKFLLGAMFVVC
jgi:hypothetical protein